MRADVQVLAGRIWERNVAHPEQLAAAEDFLAAALGKAGYRVEWQTFRVGGVNCSNLIAEMKGTTRPDEILIVGAHYDAVAACPAANDNASGGGHAALAWRIAATPQERTIRFVLFVNEEPPYFWSDDMGSLLRDRASAGDNIGMRASRPSALPDKPGSQNYPPPMSVAYPSGHFTASWAWRSPRRS
jgi:hypothetical protein